MKPETTRHVGLRLTLVALLFGLLVGCAATSTPVQRRTPNFDYTPPETAEPNSTKITFAVVGSRFDTPVVSPAFGSVPVFDRYSRNMAEDFVEILTSRGFSVRGPFRTYDEMTFPDKEGSNLILTAGIDFREDTSGLEPAMDLMGSVLVGGSSNVYKYNGTVVVACRVNLIVSESLTNERMWTKSVNIDPVSVSLNSTRVYHSAPTFAQLLQNEAQFYNDLSAELEAQYRDVMNRTFDYLDPREMAIVDRQAGQPAREQGLLTPAWSDGVPPAPGGASLWAPSVAGSPSTRV